MNDFGDLLELAERAKQQGISGPEYTRMMKRSHEELEKMAKQAPPGTPLALQLDTLGAVFEVGFNLSGRIDELENRLNEVECKQSWNGGGTGG